MADSAAREKPGWKAAAESASRATGPPHFPRDWMQRDIRWRVEAAARPPGSFDLIVLHSVAQYLSGAELDGLLATFRKLLKPDGQLVVGDIVPPRFAAPAAAISLLRCGAENGFFIAAVLGLIRIVVSDYLRLKSKVGLSHYDEAAMLEKLTRAGYSASRAARNIGHNQWRMTFLCRPA